MPNRVAVSSADFIRNIGYWQSEAMRHPVAITHHGRERLVLAAPDLLRTDPTAAPATDQASFNQLRTAHAALLENMEEAYLAFDPHLLICGVNASAEALLNASRETLLQRTVFEALPDPLAPVMSDRLQRVLKSRKPEAFECSAFDGRRLAVRAFPMPEGVAALFYNITEQQIMRREREETLAMQTAMRGHAHVGLITLDARGRIESVDPTFCAWTGFSPHELTGHRLTDLSVIGGRRDLAAIFERVLREAVLERMDLRLLGKQGEEIAASISIAPIQTDFVARGAQVLLTRFVDVTPARAVPALTEA